MDATRLSSKKLALFLTLALLLSAAPWAQAQSLVAPGSISVSSLGGSTANQLSVTSSDGSTITFDVTVTYASGTPQWLSVNGFCTGLTGQKTPVTLTLAQGCGGSGAGIRPATITLTPTAPAGATGTTVTATLGSAQGTITATGNPGGNGSLTLSAAAGASTSGTVTLSTTNSSPIGFSVTTSGATWMTVSQTGGTTGQVFAGSNATLTVTANAAGLTSSPPQATININFNGTSTPVLVSFNVGGTSSGSLSLSQNVVNWGFTTGGTALQQAISVNTPAPTYSATITSITPTNVFWMQLTSNINGPSTVVNGTGNSTLTLSTNSNLLTLTTGSYQATVTVTDSNQNTAFITVNLSVNGGTSGLTVSPNPVTISASPGATGSTFVTVTSVTGGTLSVSIAGTGLSTSLTGSTAISANTPFQFNVFGNSTGLAQNTYSGTLTVTVGSTSQNVPVSFTVGSGGTTNTGSSVAPATLQFNFQTDGNQGNPTFQSLMIGGTQTFTAAASQSNGATTWLSVTPGSGAAPAVIFVSVAPNGLPAGAYSGTITITFADNTTQSTTVNLNITTGTPQIYANPGDWVLNQPSGTASLPFQINSTNGSQIPVTVSTSTSWLSFVSSVPTSTPSSVQVQATISGLSNGMNQGSITVSSGTSTVTIPVVVYLTNGTGPTNGVLTFTPASVTLSSQVGTLNPATTTLYVTTSGSTTLFSAAASETTCTQANWLSINVTQAYVYNGFSQPITVSATASGLPAGSCTGAIQLSANGTTQSVPVTFTVGGGISVSTSSLSFQFTSGGTTPAAQTFNVTNSAGAAVHYTVSATTTTGGSWLSVSPASGTTGTTGPISVSVNPAGMAAGTYSGTVAVTPDGGSATNVTVSFTITTPTLSVSPTSLTFNYQAGGATPAAQSVTVSGGGFTASASSTGSWLSVTPTSSAAAASISVSVSPSSLSAGTYNGTISVAGAGGTTGSATISVTLTVTAPLPNVTAVVNAASFASGALSPGEVISIGGTSIGPANPAFLTLDSSGNVATTIGGVTVTVNGVLAPLVYVSSTQINAIVPYEMAGQISASVIVKYLGQTSNGFTVQGTVAAPGIFTQSASGSGPGAILNQDYSVNGPNSPAARGSVVQVFMTGEGKTTPTAVTGKVNNVTNASQLPVPLLPVTASVGGQPAQVLFAAEAPGFVSGVMQVNLLIPQAAASGGQPIVINVGTTPSQTGVTVAVQ